MLKNLQVIYEKSRLWQGVLLLIWGVVGPFFINESLFTIYLSMDIALAQGTPLMLLVAALKLVLMNSIRALPHYLGAFLISESLSFYYRGKRRFVFNAVLTFLVIWLVYQLVGFIHPFAYDFGVPAMLIVGFVLLLAYMNLFSVHWIHKVVLLSSLLLSVQWLDVVPPLTQNGFGGGELSRDIKMFTLFLGYGNLLAWFSVVMCIAFLFCSVIQVQLLYKEHRLQITTMKNRQVEKELMNAQMDALRMRSYSEVQSLVHDLKTPLTTAQGLVTLSRLMEESPKIQEYLDKISNSITNMSDVISEILYEDKKRQVPVEELMRTVLSQISITVPTKSLAYHNNCPDACILGNTIRLSRAVTNLINNAYAAIDKDIGRISISVFREAGDVALEIQDNGRGMAPDLIAHIWQQGFSRSYSTGLGLSFTKQVIDNHKGTIDAESEEGVYTKMTIRLKEVHPDVQEVSASH